MEETLHMTEKKDSPSQKIIRNHLQNFPNDLSLSVYVKNA